jgi:hypothetical protein
VGKVVIFKIKILDLRFWWWRVVSGQWSRGIGPIGPIPLTTYYGLLSNLGSEI